MEIAISDISGRMYFLIWFLTPYRCESMFLFNALRFVSETVFCCTGVPLFITGHCKQSTNGRTIMHS